MNTIRSGRRQMKSPNPLDPNRMSPAERLAALGRLLAAGLIRINANKSSGLYQPAIITTREPSL